MPKTFTISYVNVEQEGLEPWAIVPLFKLVRKLAIEHGLPDVNKVACKLDVTVSGPDEGGNGEALKRELEDMWISATLRKDTRQLGP